MPTLATNSIVLDSVMNELRIPVSNLTERTKVQRVVNGVYADMCAKQDWWWLVRKSSGFLFGTASGANGQSFAAANSTLTVALTFNSSQVVFSSAPNSANLLQGSASVWFDDGTPDAQSIYRVMSSYAGGATDPLLLDGKYGGPTATGVTMTGYRDTMPVNQLGSDTAKILRVNRYGSPEDMKKIGIEEMSQLKQWDRSVGRPQMWTVWDFDTSGDPSADRLIQFHPYPDANYRLEVWYKHQNIQDTSTDLSLPMDYQQALIYGALARGYPIFLNDLERGTFYQSLFNDVMALMANQQREYASDKPGIATDMRGYRKTSNRTRWPGRSLGRYFDIFPYSP